MLSGDRHAAACALAARALAEERPVAWITLVERRGSAPRERGACLCLSGSDSAGSIGGGALEWHAERAARALLDSEDDWQLLALGLGPALGQCCGGRVRVLIERLQGGDTPWLREARAGRGEQLHTQYDRRGRRKWLDGAPAPIALGAERGQFSQPLFPGRHELLLFGAGHLGSALVPLLQTLPLRLHWVDPREALLPASAPGLRCEWLETPELALRTLSTRTSVLVMSHDHQLDFRLCSAALAEPLVDWVGLIGSAAKRRRFERRWRAAGRAPPGARLACPLAPAAAGPRDPAALALQLAAEIACRCHAPTACSGSSEAIDALP